MKQAKKIEYYVIQLYLIDKGICRISTTWFCLERKIGPANTADLFIDLAIKRQKTRSKALLSFQIPGLPLSYLVYGSLGAVAIALLLYFFGKKKNR